MKKIHFIFKNNDVAVYDKVLDMRVENEYVFFELDNFVFKIRGGEDLEFCRISQEDEFLLKEANGLAKCEVRLKELDRVFEVPVLEYSRCQEGQQSIIKYRLESDSEYVKTIILSFVI